MEAGIIKLSSYVSGEWLTFPKVIQTSQFSSLSYSPNGMIAEFEIIDVNGDIKTYSDHVFKSDNGNYLQYLCQEEYHLYKAELIGLSDVGSYKSFTFAEPSDNVKIYKRHLDLYPTPKCCYTFINWSHTGNEVLLQAGSDEIVLPTNHTYATPNCTWLSSNAQSFYNSYASFLVNGQLGRPDEKRDLHEVITNISLLIDRINPNIFDAFNGNNPNLELAPSTLISDSVQDQNAIHQGPTNYLNLWNLEDLREYYHKLRLYYNQFLIDLAIIESSTDLEKKVQFFLPMHPSVIAYIDVEQKIDILKYLVDEKLSTTFDEIGNSWWNYVTNNPVGLSMYHYMRVLYENLAVKICQSFNSSSLLIHSGTDTHIDVFLTKLTEIMKSTGITLYEALYDRMSKSLNITETFIGISNWLADTDYKPQNTRGHFVHAVYALWESSKFNPYDIIGNLKPKSMGIKILNNNPQTSKAYISNENDSKNQNCLFYYSNEAGYKGITVTQNCFASSQSITRTKFVKKHDDASPLVMPYESEKKLGVYFDNFSFEISGTKIKAFESKLTGFSCQNDGGSGVSVHEYHSNVFYGIYDLFQPVTLINVDVETKVPILVTTGNLSNFNGTQVNSLTPMFVLHYIDDAGDRSDAETMLGFALDVGLTFSGIGNLAKLRHLRWFGSGAKAIIPGVAPEAVSLFSKQGARIVLGATEFTSGALGFIANFVECGPNDTFCKRFKEFITIMEIASGTISGADSIVTLALRRKAAQVIIESGGGVDEAAIKANVKDKLDNYPISGSADDTADAVTDLGKDEFLNHLSLLSQRVDDLYDEIYPKLLKRIKNSDGAFQKSAFLTHFTEVNMKQVIKDCFEFGISEENIHDIILISCRAGKNLTYDETRVVINYYTKVVRKRGFTTGFMTLSDYELFSVKVKTFLDEYCKRWKIRNATYEIQGSALFKSHPNDPNVNDVPVLEKNGVIVPPDDLDGRILMSRYEANKFLKEVRRYWKDYLKKAHPTMSSEKLTEKLKKKMKPMNEGVKKGMIYKGSMPPMPPPPANPPKYTNQMNQVVKDNGNDIFYPKSNKFTPPRVDVGFSIIIKGSDYDVGPVISLKY